jgi:hypothetical protein
MRKLPAGTRRAGGPAAGLRCLIWRHSCALTALRSIPVLPRHAPKEVVLAVVLREATRMVGVAPDAAYRHFADRDEFLAAVCAVAGRDRHGIPTVCSRGAGPVRDRFRRAGAARLPRSRRWDRTPLGQLGAALDELVDVGVLDRQRRDGIEYPIWSAVHGIAVLADDGPSEMLPQRTGVISRTSPSPSSPEVRRGQVSEGKDPRDQTQGWRSRHHRAHRAGVYGASSSTVKIILRTGASSWRRAASAAVAWPSGEANAACSSSIVSHSNSVTR